MAKTFSTGFTDSDKTGSMAASGATTGLLLSGGNPLGAVAGGLLGALAGSYMDMKETIDFYNKEDEMKKIQKQKEKMAEQAEKEMLRQSKRQRSYAERGEDTPMISLGETDKEIMSLGMATGYDKFMAKNYGYRR